MVTLTFSGVCRQQIMKLLWLITVKCPQQQWSHLLQVKRIHIGTYLPTSMCLAKSGNWQSYSVSHLFR